MGGGHVGGGGMSGMSMGRGGSSFRGMGPSMNFGPSLGNSLHSSSGLGMGSPPGQFSRSTMHSGLNGLPNLGSVGSKGTKAFSGLPGAMHGDSQHASLNRNWQQGEHFSQLNGKNFDGKNFNGQNFDGKNFNHFDHDFHHHNCFVVAPFWWPWWYSGFGDCYYGYGYNDYGVPYCYNTVGYETPVNDGAAYDSGVYDSATYNNSLPQSTEQLPQEYPQPDSNSSQSGAVFFGQAEEAFSAGRYRDAVRLANHAAVESPQNPKAPELMSLALFALGDYRGGAAQAHAALALGPPADWATVYGYYGNLETYTKQLRNLEKYCKEKPTAPEGHFLLAYQYLLSGFPKQGGKEFDEVVKLAPQDKLAAELQKKYSGNSSRESLPTPPAPMPIEQ